MHYFQQLVVLDDAEVIAYLRQERCARGPFLAKVQRSVSPLSLPVLRPLWCLNLHIQFPV